MKQILMTYMVLCVVAIVGCKKDDSGPTARTTELPSGTTTISGTSANGFSFSLGKVLSPPFVADSWPDFEVFYETGSGGPTVLGYCFTGTNPDGTSRPTFRLLRQTTTPDSAHIVFQRLDEIPDTTFVYSTGENQIIPPGMRPWQIYGVKTYNGHYAKILVISNESGPSGVAVTFSWAYQPNGGRQF